MNDVGNDCWFALQEEEISAFGDDLPQSPATSRLEGHASDDLHFHSTLQFSDQKPEPNRKVRFPVDCYSLDIRSVDAQRSNADTIETIAELSELTRVSIDNISKIESNSSIGGRYHSTGSRQCNDELVRLPFTQSLGPSTSYESRDQLNILMSSSKWSTLLEPYRRTGSELLLEPCYQKDTGREGSFRSDSNTEQNVERLAQHDHSQDRLFESSLSYAVDRKKDKPQTTALSNSGVDNRQVRSS